MKKITFLILSFVFLQGFSQSKTTGVVNLTTNMTANITLNNTTSKATLVLTGPSDRWFAMGIGVMSGFGMSAGDVVVYSANALTDRNYIGFQAPAVDASQDWSTISDNVNAGVRTLTLERNLTTTDSNDFQLPYASTNSISLAWARGSTANQNVSSHGGSNRGFANGSFTTLSNADFSLNATSIYPNPSNGDFLIKTKTNLTKVNVYNQTGALVKNIEINDQSNEVEVSVNGLQSGIYFLELLNDSEKSWKKVIVN